MRTTLPPAVSGERFEFSSAAGRLSAYLAGPSGSVDTGDAAGAAVQLPPLLLIHSINASASAAEMRPLHAHYSATRMVCTVDLPGYGFSDRSDRTYTPRLMTDAVHAVAAQLQARSGAARIDALALSLSCEYLARAAAENPGPYRSVALVSPTGFRGLRPWRAPPGTTRGKPWLYQALRGPGSGWGAGLFRGLTRPAVVRYFLQRTWGSKHIDEELWAYDLLTTKVPGAEHAPLHFLAANLFSADIHTVYEQLAMPVWMSHGVRGDFTDYRGKVIVEGRPNWQFSVFPTGALPYFEQPQDFCVAFDRFLAALAAPAAATHRA